MKKSFMVVQSKSNDFQHLIFYVFKLLLYLK